MKVEIEIEVTIYLILVYRRIDNSRINRSFLYKFQFVIVVEGFVNICPADLILTVRLFWNIYCWRANVTYLESTLAQ